jgi:succinate dehydrogenase / fumarate reductase flavoprotein subunit
MGGVRVDGDTQMSTVPGLFAAGEAAAGLHGANRLGGNSLSDLLVFGQRAGAAAAEYATKQGSAIPDAGEVNQAVKDALAPFERTTGESPYAVQQDLQKMMQNWAGIVRTEADMLRAAEGLGKLRERATKVGVPGNREYNPGWHTALDLRHLLTVSEVIVASALARKESRGGHFRDDYPEKRAEFAGSNFVATKDAGGTLALKPVAIAPMPDELTKLVEEFK